MKRPLIIEMVPQTRHGDVVYVNGLGTTASTTTAVGNMNTAATAVNAVTSLLPDKPVTHQTDFSKVANTVGAVAGTVAAYAVYLYPVGTVVAAVAGIVAAACLLLGKLFANSKSKAMAAERAQYESAIAQLQFENVELDNQYSQTFNAVQQMRQMISGLNGVDGLGLCLFNCKDEKAKLNTTKAEYEALQKQFDEKTKALMTLIDEFNKLMREYSSLLQTSQAKDVALYAILGVAVLGAGIAIMSGSKK